MTPEQELDLKLNEPEPGSVIRLRVAFEGPKTYTYAVLGLEGLWYVTGAEGGAARTWSTLIAWLKSKGANVVSIERATEWETL